MPPLDSAMLGRVLAQATYGPIGREQLRQYAAASGDSNPLHLDPVFAKQAGFDDVIVHGMLGMALLGRLVNEQLPSWRLTRLRTRFRGIVELGQTLTCAATLAGLNGERVEIDLTGRNAGGEIVLDGSATLAPPGDAPPPPDAPPPADAP